MNLLFFKETEGKRPGGWSFPTEPERKPVTVLRPLLQLFPPRLEARIP